MKKLNASLVMILLSMAGFTGCQQSGSQHDDLITVDVSASYPEKELVLQDFMDVEYVPLETNDEFITQGIVEAIGKKVIVVRNMRDGNIFVYDRATGKGIKKINRFGQGAEEYSSINSIILDDDNNEMFVSDYPARKISVYDLSGNYKRSFKYADTGYYDDIFNYDRDHLICYKKYSTPKEDEQACHLLVSKQDGSVTREIRIPFKAYKTPVIMKDELTVVPEFHLMFPNQNNWILVNTSSDTLYNYLADGNMYPVIARTPSINTMETEVFLFPTVITDRYYFMRTMKKELDYKTFKGFPGTDLFYDKQEKTLSQFTMYNGDYSNKRSISFLFKPRNSEIAISQSLQAPDLVEAYEKGQLKGKLKEIAAGLDEEANPVIMLAKYKK
ncbi:6-bladed beta-propeller [uncultured Parabacteroides sp.]|uniref:6-bladed beta-propeller n=1 Tax=uncultured Parabacteroides sp. TaxID=512312 RepID=UPI0025DB4416|nr:6-bladed beta-propeller [uncultured Parabacteroides sp.]